MLIVRSHNDIPIRLTQERWRHIVQRHPEMRDQRERVLETLTDPDMVQQGDFGALLALRFYTDTPLTSKYLVVAYREVSADDGFYLTAYFPVGHRRGELRYGSGKDSRKTHSDRLGL